MSAGNDRLGRIFKPLPGAKVPVYSSTPSMVNVCNDAMIDMAKLANAFTPIGIVKEGNELHVFGPNIIGELALFTTLGNEILVKLSIVPNAIPVGHDINDGNDNVSSIGNDEGISPLLPVIVVKFGSDSVVSVVNEDTPKPTQLVRLGRESVDNDTALVREKIEFVVVSDGRERVASDNKPLPVHEPIEVSTGKDNVSIDHKLVGTNADIDVIDVKSREVRVCNPVNVQALVKVVNDGKDNVFNNGIAVIVNPEALIKDGKDNERNRRAPVIVSELLFTVVKAGKVNVLNTGADVVNVPP